MEIFDSWPKKKVFVHLVFVKMAIRLRSLLGRKFRVYFPVCLMAFLAGILFGLFVFCSQNESALVVQKRTEEDKVIAVRVTAEPKERKIDSGTDLVQEEKTDAPTIKEIPTFEPYPPLLQKKGFIITPQDCPKDLFLLIIVVTSSRNFEARKAIRRSWGEDNSKKNETSDKSFRVIYVVGSDDGNDKLIKREGKRYKDILRGGFKDVYRKNEAHSVKTLLGLKWATISCKAKYILKTTADSFVNTDRMLSFLRQKKDNDQNEGLYMGFCHGANVGGARVVRNVKSPWYISEEDWPEKNLPPYASGIGITVSYDVAEKIVDLSLKEKLIHIEDVYLGIMAKKLSLTCTDESTIFDTSYTTMLTECEDINFGVIGGVPSRDMYYLTQNSKNLNDIC